MRGFPATSNSPGEKMNPPGLPSWRRGDKSRRDRSGLNSGSTQRMFDACVLAVSATFCTSSFPSIAMLGHQMSRSPPTLLQKMSFARRLRQFCDLISTAGFKELLCANVVLMTPRHRLPPLVRLLIETGDTFALDAFSANKTF